MVSHVLDGCIYFSFHDFCPKWGMILSLLRLVLLTHIPPFMDSFDEPEGWANWRQVYRKQILDVLAASELPLLFICGHFHANVVKDATYQGRPLNIRVSSAAGTTIQWDGKDNLTPEEAQKVASKRATWVDW